MSGFDLPPVRGFEYGGPLAPRLRELLAPPGVQGPERAGTGERGDAVPDDVAQPFAGVLADSIEQVKGLHDDVKAKVRGLVMGEDVELHDVLIAGNKSEVAFNLLLEVRNKLVDAWEKLSRSAV